MRRAPHQVGRGARAGFTLVELILSLGLFSLLLVGLLQLLDTSTTLWKRVDAQRDETEVAGALAERIARDLSTLEAGPEGDLLVDWAMVDVDGNGTAGLPVARLRFVRRAAPGEVTRLRADQAVELDPELLTDEVLAELEAAAGWARIDRGLVETTWVLAKADRPVDPGARVEPAFEGVLLRGERFLGDPDRISFFDERFLPVTSTTGRPTAGLTDELLRGVLWLEPTLATQTTVTDADLHPEATPRRWEAGDGLDDGATSWDAWGLDRPDLSRTERNEPGVGMPDLDPARPGATPLLPRRIRVAFEIQPPGALRPTLRSSIDHTETTFAVSDGLRLPEPGGHVLVGEEWMLVRDVRGDRVTVERAVRGSQRGPHGAGALVQHGWRTEREVPVAVFREDWSL